MLGHTGLGALWVQRKSDSIDGRFGGLFPRAHSYSHDSVSRVYSY